MSIARATTLSFVLVSPFTAVAAVAQEGPLVGQPAPPFSADTCIHPPEIVESDRLLGEVIVLEFWGIT